MSELLAIILFFALLVFMATIVVEYGISIVQIGKLSKELRKYTENNCDKIE